MWLGGWNEVNMIENRNKLLQNSHPVVNPTSADPGSGSWKQNSNGQFKPHQAASLVLSEGLSMILGPEMCDFQPTQPNHPLALSARPITKTAALLPQLFLKGPSTIGLLLVGVGQV